MGDIVRGGFIAIAMPLLALAVASWLLHYFVALTAAPARRAAWTVGSAYVLVTILAEFTMPPDYWWTAPLAAIPGAVIAFLWWKGDFRKLGSTTETASLKASNSPTTIGESG